MKRFASYSLLWIVFFWALTDVRPLEAQQVESVYEINFRPDLWYNSTDGIRIGTRMEGRMAGTGEEGPHRLDAGAWLGLWLPKLPVSYHVTYTEPFSALSEPESEFHIQLLTSVREGFQEHGATLRKRWQMRDDFRNFWELGGSFHMEQMFNDRYRIFPSLWESDWHGWSRAFLDHQHINRLGQFRMNLAAGASVLEEPKGMTSLSLAQQVRIYNNWQFRLRFHGEAVDPELPPQYKLFRSSGNQMGQLPRPLMRSRGTVPPDWIQNGHVHLAGGANMRGYTDQDMRALREGTPLLYTRMAAFNSELDIPNPIQQGISHVDVLREFIAFRSYLFGGIASLNPSSDSVLETTIAEAGAGVALSINIPDHLGKDRGFALRYEVPFWLSEPLEEKEWKWRHLVGIGAVITF